MDPILIAAVVFAFTFGGALLGLWMHSRLPAHHMVDATKDTVKLGIGMVATMTALVLGLVTASAKNSFDSVDSAVKHTAIDLLTLDRLLARYGPETTPTRAALKSAIGRKIELLWPQDGSNPAQADPSVSGAVLEGLVDSIRALTPRDDAQRHLQSRALDLGESLLTTRWLAVADQSTSIPFAFLVVLLSWLLIIFASFGLFAPRNATVVVVLVLCALSVAGAVFLVLEMDRPLEGLIRVSPEPLRQAFAKLNT
jgi:hypothetical protein